MTSEMHFGEGMIQGTEVAYFETDHLGSVRTIVNQYGSVLEQNDYLPFGIRINTGRTYANNRKKFNGKEIQTMGDLDHLLDYGARMYDPSGTRWFTMDPLAEMNYSVSPYAYCYNSPVMYIDPFGLWNESATGYHTDDPEDIRRFTAFQQHYNAAGQQPTKNSVYDFVNWEMTGGSSGKAGGVYASGELRTNMILDPAVVERNASGAWEWNAASQNCILGSQKEAAENGNLHTESGFVRGAFWTADQMQKWGTRLTWVGTATLFVAPEVGASMIEGGAITSFVGGSLKGGLYLARGQTELGVYMLTMNGLFFGMNRFIKWAGAKGGFSPKTLLPQSILYNAGELAIGHGESLFLKKE